MAFGNQNNFDYFLAGSPLEVIGKSSKTFDYFLAGSPLDGIIETQAPVTYDETGSVVCSSSVTISASLQQVCSGSVSVVSNISCGNTLTLSGSPSITCSSSVSNIATVTSNITGSISSTTTITITVNSIGTFYVYDPYWLLGNTNKQTQLELSSENSEGTLIYNNTDLILW